MEKEDLRIEQTKYLVELFLNTNKSDLELEKMTGISHGTIQRRLTDEKRYMQAFGENYLEKYQEVMTKRKNNKDLGKQKGGLNSYIHYSYERGNNGYFNGKYKLRLDLVYKDEENQFKFLQHIILYFHLNSNTVMELFNYKNLNSDELKEYFKNNSGNLSNVLLNNLDGNYNQELAKNKFLIYYDSLVNTIKNNNHKELKRLVSIVTDERIINLKNTYQKDNLLSSEDLRIIRQYIDKYGLTEKEALLNIGIDENAYYDSLESLNKNKVERSA